MSNDNEQPMSEERRRTDRIEAFSDGVFAIALTLLVLDIKVPRDLPPDARLTAALLNQWPTYLAFVTSFATIGIMWINHHRLFDLIRRSDNNLMLLNLLLLLGVTVVPFPTSLLAEYLGHPEEHAAAAVYAGMSVVIAILFNLLWRYAAHENRLLDEASDREAIRAITKGYSFGPVFYLIAFGFAFVNVPVSVIIVLALAVFFALPIKMKRPGK